MILALVGLGACGKADDAIMTSFPGYDLRGFLNDAEYIGVGALSAPDPKNFRTGIRLLRSLKGSQPLTTWSLDIQGFTPNKVIARHLAEGSPVVVFSTNSCMAIYINRFFLISYGDAAKGAWSSTTIEGQTNQTFNGTALELAALAEKVLKGEQRPPVLNTKLPPITTAALKKLPAWDEGVSDADLPPPFRKVAPPPVVPLAPEKPEKTIPGLEVAVLAGSPFSGDETPATIGTDPLPDSHHGSDERRQGLRFRGFLDVPKDGDYAFTTPIAAGDTVELMIGSTRVSTQGAIPEYVPLQAGKHPVTLKFLGLGGPGHLELYWSGPDLPKERIPSRFWSRYP